MSSKLIRRLEANKKQVVVTYGTSLTAEGGWVTELRDALEARWPGQTTVINSGKCAMESRWGVSNLESRVIENRPDTVFMEFAINDCVERFHCSVEESRANLEAMIDGILSAQTDCEIILMTMTPGDLCPPGHVSCRTDISDYYAMIRDMARERKLLLIDHDPNWRALRARDPSLFQAYVPDSVHPTPAGWSTVVSPVILAAIGIHR